MLSGVFLFKGRDAATDGLLVVIYETNLTGVTRLLVFAVDIEDVEEIAFLPKKVTNGIHLLSDWNMIRITYHYLLGIPLTYPSYWACNMIKNFGMPFIINYM